jgi:hypothetical protein
MAFKGILPSDLWIKYNVEGGRHLMDLDLIIAANINDITIQATQGAMKKDARGAVARRNQRREQRKLLSNNDELLDVLRDSGVPVKDRRESRDDKHDS